MAPGSRKSLYKTKIREENTITTRRQSRCLERKQNRDEEINKRRRLSNDLSLLDDKSYQDEDEEVLEPVKRAVRPKVNTQLERLQKWREEKKRKVEQEKQNKKPAFRVTSVAHKGETELYKKDDSKEVKHVKNGDKLNSVKLPSTAKVVNDSTKPKVKVIKDLTKPKVKTGPSQVASQKPASSGGISSANNDRITKSAKATKEVPKKPEVNLAAASKPSTRRNPAATQDAVQGKRNFSDLSKKQTVSAAAKAKINLETEKPKEFLRGKSRAPLIKVPNKKLPRGKKDNITEHQNEYEQKAEVEVHATQENKNLDDNAVSESNHSGNTSEDKELHLSESDVPTPKHSTPAPRRSARVKTEFENIRKLEFEDASTRRSQRSKITTHIDSSHIEAELCPTLEQKDTDDTQLSAAACATLKSEQRVDKMRSALVKRKSVRIVDSDMNSEDEVCTAKYPRTPGIKHKRNTRARSLASEDAYRSVSDEGASDVKEIMKRESNVDQQKEETQQAINTCHVIQGGNTLDDAAVMESVLSDNTLEVKELHLSDLVVSTPHTSREQIELHPNLEQIDTDGIQLPVIESATVKSEHRGIIRSASVKRKSVRIAASDINSEDEVFSATYVRTPGIRHQRSTRARSLAQEEGSGSSYMSVSDEGTSDIKELMNKENTADQLEKVLQETENAGYVVTRRGNNLDDATVREPVLSDSSSCFTELHLSDLAVPTPSTRREEIELCPRLEHMDTDDTQLPVFESATVKSEQRAKIRSASVKRKSVRIAASVSSESDINSETEVVAAKYPRTPGVKRQRSTRASSAHKEGRRTTCVSVSDEGTSNVAGKSEVDVIKDPDTPRIMQHAARGKSKNQRRSVRIEVNSVSDKQPALSNDHDAAESELSSRALQELVVEKLEGEISFIEVPVDESTDGNVADEARSSPKHSDILPSGDQVMVDNISSTTEVDSQVMVDDVSSTTVDSQSTQPFTPRRSNDMSKLTVSSSQSSAATSVTPRSTRSRRMSLAGLSSFKTPSQPASILRTRNKSKRRKTEHSVTIKSPEEMMKILKKSPMIELTRRRSRHIASPAMNNSAYVEPTLVAASPSLHKSEETVTETMDIDASNTQDVSCNAGLATTTSQHSETVQLDLNDSKINGVQHFRDLLLSESNKLIQLCNKWNEVSSSCNNLNEEARGHIRSTVGKAHLLMDQRFKQFSGLIDDCEFSLGEKETTLTDLQGFWDMIHFQVEDVHQLFASLNDMQQNNWDFQQPAPINDIPKQRKVVKIYKPKIKSNFAAFREEMKRRKAQATSGASSTAAVTEVDPETTKVFDAGFFKVNSPIKSPSVKKSQPNTPLKSVVSDAEQAAGQTQENSSEAVEKPAQISTEQLSGPGSRSDKENKITRTPSRNFASMSAKRLSYLPVIPSPLLNDITGQTPKK